MSILESLLRLVRRPKPPPEPSTLAEAIAVLEQELSPETIQAIREPQSEMAKYHHGLGRQIRNRWNFWGESPLKDHLRGLGLCHADDMSSLVLTSFRRHLRGEPLRVEEQVKKHQEYWASYKVKGVVFKL